MKVVFKPQAFQKIRAYVDTCPYEISGFGKIEKTEEALVVEDVKIFPQKVTAGNTIMDAGALAAFWDELMVAGEDIGKWKLWWHSHVYMTAHFSGTDLATIEEFDNESPEENWILSLVTNKYGDVYARVDIFDPIRCSIGNMRVEIEEGSVEEIDVLPEIKQKVTVLNPREGQQIEWGERSFVPVLRKPVLSEEERKKLREQFFGKQALVPLLPSEEVIVLGPDGKPLETKN